VVTITVTVNLLSHIIWRYR